MILWSDLYTEYKMSACLFNSLMGFSNFHRCYYNKITSEFDHFRLYSYVMQRISETNSGIMYPITKSHYSDAILI